MGLDFLIITFFSHIGERLSLIILLIVSQTGLILIFFTNIPNFLESGLSSTSYGEIGFLKYQETLTLKMKQVENDQILKLNLKQIK